MAIKYFLYSDEQIAEKNKILEKSGKCFVPGVVTKNGKRIKYTQLSDSADMSRYVDTKVIVSGELSTFTYTKPTSQLKKG